MAVEFERKYRADPAIFGTIRQDLPGAEEIYQMQTTYYDTPSGAFSRQRCTLRLRMENGRSICTLKAPTGGEGRLEWEAKCDRIEAAVSVLCKQGVPESLLAPAKEGLIPICGAAFTRIAKTVTLADSVVEVALDEGILTGGNKKLPFGELEVELKSGTEEACLAFAGEIAARYGLEEEPRSKFARALALYKGE
jgi:inorganic triphosphatase YgiF